MPWLRVISGQGLEPSGEHRGPEILGEQIKVAPPRADFIRPGFHSSAPKERDILAQGVSSGWKWEVSQSRSDDRAVLTQNIKTGAHGAQLPTRCDTREHRDPLSRLVPALMWVDSSGGAAKFSPGRKSGVWPPFETGALGAQLPPATGAGSLRLIGAFFIIL
jgi:hypothetical protein